LNTPYTQGLTSYSSGTIITTTSSASYVTQIAIPNGARRLYTRSVSGGDPLEWVEFYSTNNKPTPTEIGASDIAAVGVNIPSNSNLDTYTTPGTYRSVDSSNSATLTNPPTTASGFKLDVIQAYSANYRQQIASYNSTIWIRHSTNATAANISAGTVTWSEWQYVYTNAIKLAITNNTTATANIVASTNLPTMNTLRYALNRTNGVAGANTSYTTLMARGTSLHTADTNPSVNGAIAWTYK
jgi:hypothetical protein